MRRSCSRLEASELLAGGAPRLGGGVGVGEGDLEQGPSRVSGVRSSWEALATKCRWASKAASRRAKRSSRVSPSCLNSSSAPSRASRSCRLVAEIRRAVAVMVRTGRSTRPATNQPSSEGEHGHDGEGDPGVDQQVVEVRRALGAAAARCRREPSAWLPLAVAQGAGCRRRWRSDMLLADGSLEEQVGDGEQGRAREEESAP